jgi:hypothetical protein
MDSSSLPGSRTDRETPDLLADTATTKEGATKRPRVSRVAPLAIVALALLACRAGPSPHATSPAQGDATSQAAWTPPAAGEKWWTRATACPQGATLKGAAPPSGSRVWCETEGGSYEGPATSFYADGVRRSDALYRGGRMHGQWRQFFPDGRPRSQGEYDDGRDVGEWRSFHDNGKLATEAKHLDDGTVAFVAYGPRGEKEREGKFVDGVEHGEWTVWGTDGKPQTVVYDKGKIVTGGVTSRWHIGIPECDEYINRYTKCISDKVPESAKTIMMDAMDQSAKAWQEAAQGPAKDGLATACRAALAAARQATASMGCEW